MELKGKAKRKDSPGAADSGRESVRRGFGPSMDEGVRRSPAASVRGKEDVVNLKDIPGMFRTIRDMITSLKNLNCEFQMRLPDGEEFWLVPEYGEIGTRNEVSFRDASTLAVVSAATGGKVISMKFLDKGGLRKVIAAAKDEGVRPGPDVHDDLGYEEDREIDDQPAADDGGVDEDPDQEDDGADLGGIDELPFPPSPSGTK